MGLCVTGINRMLVMKKSIHSDKYNEFLSLLIIARKESNITQQALADKLNKPQSFVSKYEKGERRLDVIELISIANAIGTKASNIVKKLEQ